jgi:hypothetical protein
MEALEKREVMAVSAVTLAADTLTIRMDSQGGDVRSYTEGSKIVVEDRDPGGLFFTTPDLIPAP